MFPRFLNVDTVLQPKIKAMENSSKKKILIVDDHPMMRKGLKSTIESEDSYKVVCMCDKAEQVLDEMDGYNFDLMMVDISLPGMNGIELVKNVVYRNAEQKIIVISRHEETLYAERALRAGAKGYIMKYESASAILQAIQKVLGGGIYVSEEVNEQLLNRSLYGDSDSGKSLIESLSDRELEVFELIGKGKASSDIANQLHLTKKTIETYKSRIKEKMGFKNANDMLVQAVKWISIEDV